MRNRIIVGSFLLTAGSVVAAASAFGTGTPSGRALLRLEREDAARPRVDRTLFGWRVASGDVLAGEGLLTGERLSCEYAELDPTQRTDLDFRPPARLQGAAIERVLGPEKDACGITPTTVGYRLRLGTRFGVGELFVQRMRVNRKTLLVDAAADRVRAGRIGGHDAILVEPPHRSGYGQGEVFVFEDHELRPFATVFHVVGYNVPLSELVRVAKEVG